MCTDLRLNQTSRYEVFWIARGLGSLSFPVDCFGVLFTYHGSVKYFRNGSVHDRLRCMRKCSTKCRNTPIASAPSPRLTHLRLAQNYCPCTDMGATSISHRYSVLTHVFSRETTHFLSAGSWWCIPFGGFPRVRRYFVCTCQKHTLTFAQESSKKAWACSHVHPISPSREVLEK